MQCRIMTEAEQARLRGKARQGGQAALRALKFRPSAGPFFCFAYSAFHAGMSARAREISRMARSASGTSVLFVAKQITNGSRA